MRTIALTLAAVGVLSATGFLVWHGTPESAAAPSGAGEEMRTIPLNSCYATFEGNGLKELGISASREIRERTSGGASNVALLRGADLAAAVRAASRVFAGGWPADAP